MSAVLDIADLSVLRGAKTVVHDVSMRIEAGKTVALLGPNGAGKSSLVLALAGVLPVGGGKVTLDGSDLTGLDPAVIRKAGIAAVPEGHEVLTALTVKENLEVAAAGSGRGKGKNALDRGYHIFPELVDLRDRIAGSLSGGQQQMLALAQALVRRAHRPAAVARGELLELGFPGGDEGAPDFAALTPGIAFSFNGKTGELHVGRAQLGVGERG